jgi:hypothetical protein
MVPFDFKVYISVLQNIFRMRVLEDVTRVLANGAVGELHRQKGEWRAMR